MCMCFGIGGVYSDCAKKHAKDELVHMGGRGILLTMILALTDFSQALSQGASHAWLFIPSAILLGALHGLEPGHSKTMMAAFIVAIRGTVWQATLLGLSAAISHSLLIWLLAAVALKYGGQ